MPPCFGYNQVIVRTILLFTVMPSSVKFFTRCLALGLVGVVALTGCNLFSKRDAATAGYWLPLTALLRLDQSMTNATLDYRDACGQQKILSIATPLREAVMRRVGSVFEQLQTDGSAPQAKPLDGYVNVAFGFKEIELIGVRKGKRSYPTTISLGTDFSFTDVNGVVLYQKKLQAVAKGEVETTNDSCDVRGLEKVTEEVIANLAEGVAVQLGGSAKLRELAQASKGKTRQASGVVPPPVASTVPAPMPIAAATAASTPLSTAKTPSSAQLVGEPLGPTKLSFRAIIRDENRNQVLEQKETVTVEVEVKNDGLSLAQGVSVSVGGTAAVMAKFPESVQVGDLQPGEIKRVTVSATLASVKDVEQVELVLSLRATSSNAQLPPSKKFLVAIRPDKGEELEVLSVDVDQLPKAGKGLVQPKAIGVAIGVGDFRGESVPRVKFAAHDAEIMAGYFKTLSGIPANRVRLLVDRHALKDDLADVFEAWLPKQVDPAAPVLIYFSGRAIVDATTGAVSLVPFDGTTSSIVRLYSLRRLQGALARSGVQQAIIMLEVSLEPSPGADPGQSAEPVWESTESVPGKETVLWLIGNRSHQEAHAYEQGQHGLFTYHLLKGLRGAADVNRDGIISSGELCAYVRGQVQTSARKDFGNAQEPVCMPSAGHGALIRTLPLTKVK